MVSQIGYQCITELIGYLICNNKIYLDTVSFLYKVWKGRWLVKESYEKRNKNYSFNVDLQNQLFSFSEF